MLPVDMDSDLVTANIQVQILTLSVANITESPPILTFSYPSKFFVEPPSSNKTEKCL